MSGIFGSSQWMYASGAFYNGVATQSLRLDSGSSARLEKTPSASNRVTWTWSAWVKRSKIGVERAIWSAGSSSGFALFFHSSDQLRCWTQGGNGAIYTNAVFRDTSAWYHIALTAKSSGNYFELYINGVKETSFSFDGRSTNPGGNDTEVNSNAIHYLGAWNNGGLQYFDGYLADVHFIDGTCVGDTGGILDEFIEIKNGVCIPKAYTGSYGTNGYRLEFKQTGTGTASSSTIGADTSGNANHYTSSGIVASDCDMPDSPENNFSTFNGVDTRFRSELAEGNLNLRATTYSSGNFGHSICTFPIPSSGKWYIEAYGLNITGNNTTSIGIMDRNVVSTSATQVNYSITTDEGFDGIRQGHYSSPFMRIVVDGTQSGSDISFTNQSAISALAIDVDNGYIYVGGNDGTGGTGSEITWRDYADGSTGSSNVDPTSGSSGTGGIARTFTNNDIIVCDVSVSGDNSSKSQVYLNAGQDSSFAGNLTAQGNSDANGIGDFYYQVPDGYLALCTANLPEPTISPNADTQADDYFNTVLYTGDGTTSQTITGVGFAPDFVWIKSRTSADWHAIHDKVRGVNLRIVSNSTNAESSDPNFLNSFDVDGFKVGLSGSVGGSGKNYVAWNWKAGGSAVSNTDGSITSTVSANTDAGFSIVTYTGDGANGTVGHGLNSTPEIVVTKRRDSTSNWSFNGSIGNLAFGSSVINLNVNSAQRSDTNEVTAVSSTTFTAGTSGAVGGSGNTYVAYCFHSVEGYSKFGSYTGNGSTDGTFVYTGFRPAFVMIKMTSGTQRWGMTDSARATNNPNFNTLYAEDNLEEYTGNLHDRDYLSNGFKLRNTDTIFNGSGSTYIYMAFAENPFKYANAR